MELEWAGKALSNLARVYEFLAPVNRSASRARKVGQATSSGGARHGGLVNEIDRGLCRDVVQATGRCLHAMREWSHRACPGVLHVNTG